MNKDTKQRFDVDPVLEKISSHIPDDEIDFLFPFRKFNTQVIFSACWHAICFLNS
jgi:hypothetical protein